MLLTENIDVNTVAEVVQVDPNALDKFMKELPDHLLIFGVRVILCLLVFWVGGRIIRLLRKIVRKAMEKSKLDPGASSFIDSFLKAVLYVILIFLILTSFGVNAASLAAILGSAGVAVGLAIQGSLANFAGGVLILLLKPFVVGDYIEESAHGHAGVVTKIQVFYTYLRTLEGREVVIPNGQLSNNSLVNFKGNHTAGCLIPVGVSYDTDLKMAREVLIGAIEENPYVLKEKGYSVNVKEFADSAIVFTVFCHFRVESYYMAKTSLLIGIKEAFDQEGITIPFTQIDLQIKRDMV